LLVKVRYCNLHIEYVAKIGVLLSCLNLTTVMSRRCGETEEQRRGGMQRRPTSPEAEEEGGRPASPEVEEEGRAACLLEAEEEGGSLPHRRHRRRGGWPASPEAEEEGAACLTGGNRGGEGGLPCRRQRRRGVGGAIPASAASRVSTERS
jgi:hypothetical protein